MGRTTIPQWVFDLLFLAFVVGLMMTAIILSTTE